jgi:uncharacterized membrane protein
MELIEYLEGGLAFIASLIKILLEALGIFTILIGIIINGRQAMFLLAHPNARNYIRVRTRFARALALALEFQLGADILATAVAPSYRALGQLGAIAVIRTFLNYFLAKEIEELKEEEQQEINRD